MTSSWDARQSITDPAHVATAAVLRRAYQNRGAATSTTHETRVAARALTDYDDLFNLGSASSRPTLKVAG